MARWRPPRPTAPLEEHDDWATAVDLVRGTGMDYPEALRAFEEAVRGDSEAG